MEGAFLDCIICGERGLADVILNIALFLPFGAAAGLAARSWQRALVCAILLSIGIEWQQQGIPGRHSSVGDLVFNTVGASLGILLTRTARHWVVPPPALAARLSLAAACATAVTIAATGWVLMPALPRSKWFVDWTATLAHLHRYDATVLESVLGKPYTPGQLDDSRAFQHALQRGDTLAVLAIAGHLPRGLAPLFSIHDGEKREVLLAGPDREDFVLRVYSRATRLRLDQPDLRAARAMRGIGLGDSLDVRIRLGARGHCLTVNDHSSCSYWFTGGRGWALLLYLERFPPWLRGLLDATWVGLLCFPIGLWARRRVETLAAFAIGAAGLFLVPHVAGLLATPMLEVAGAIAGIGAGVAVHRLVRRTAPQEPSGAPVVSPAAGSSTAAGQALGDRDA